MDVRLTTEQRGLRDAAARLGTDLGPKSVHDLADVERIGRLEKAVDATGWRALRSDGASGVEVAIVLEEFGRRLVDVPFLGPVLADDLRRHVGDEAASTIAVNDEAIDAGGIRRTLRLEGVRVVAGRTGELLAGADLTRTGAQAEGPGETLGELTEDLAERWQALSLVATCADLVGTARGAHTLACDYAKVREQYGHPIATYQAIAHLLAEGLALIEGSISVLRHAAWAVDELPARQARQAARVAKLYCGRAARTVCESAVQVHGGIGNTWDCLAHVYLRRALTSTDLFPTRLEEMARGLS
jgi:hypothetical protein